MFNKSIGRISSTQIRNVTFFTKMNMSHCSSIQGTNFNLSIIVRLKAGSIILMGINFFKTLNYPGITNLSIIRKAGITVIISIIIIPIIHSNLFIMYYP